MTPDQANLFLTNFAQPAIFAGLFIWLFVATRAESKERETWFRATIKELTDELRTMGIRLDSIEEKVGRKQG